MPDVHSRQDRRAELANGGKKRREPVNRPAMSGETLASVGRHLESFAASLSPGERAALTAVINIGDRSPAAAALSREPAEAVLEPYEIEIVEALAREPAPAGQTLNPHTVMVMKATRFCNLRCTYCRFWSDKPNQIMPFEVMARATHGALTSPRVHAVDFCWHGGEPSLLPTDFYRKAIWVQQRFQQPGQYILNSMQTNGTRLTPAWLDFLKRYDFSVGVSLDGPPEVHDARRVDIRGRATSKRVREGLEKLRAHGIEHGVLMVVDEQVVEVGANRVLDYLLEIGVRDVAALNALPSNAPVDEPFYHFDRHVQFFIDLFRAWWPKHVDRINLRELGDLIRRVRGDRGRLCIFDGNCMGGILTIEPNGDIGACDKYLGDDEYRWGNVLELPLSDINQLSQFQSADTSTEAGVQGTTSCEWFGVCHGGCPHDRYLRGRKRVEGYDEACCGLKPLLEEISKVISATASPAAPAGHGSA